MVDKIKKLLGVRIIGKNRQVVLELIRIIEIQEQKIRELREFISAVEGYLSTNERLSKKINEILPGGVGFFSSSHSSSHPLGSLDRSNDDKI